MDHFVGHLLMPKSLEADQQDSSLLHIRSSMFHRITVRLVWPQTPYSRRNPLSRLGLLYAQSMYRVLSILPRSRHSDSMGK